MDQLAFSRIHYQAIRTRIAEAHPDLDEQTLLDTVEGLTDLHEVLAAVVRSAISDEALGDGLRGHIARMQERLQRFEQRAASRRQLARDVMLEADIRKLTAPDFTASLRAGTPSATIIDEAAIPDQYWEPRPPRLNRQSLTADLKGGGSITGATLSNPEPVLSVRTR